MKQLLLAAAALLVAALAGAVVARSSGDAWEGADSWRSAHVDSVDGLASTTVFNVRPASGVPDITTVIGPPPVEAD